jgi:glycosyltransferase involved in cell wall biosynthesis
MNRKIIISINTAWNIFNFRAGLIRTLINQGYQVIAVAPRDDYVQRLESLGCHFVAVQMDNNGTNPVRDMALLSSYFRIFRIERPLAYLGYTIKPNIYGSLAARALGIPVINNISGLGSTFLNNNSLIRVVRLLYKVSLHQSHRVFFQNKDDELLFIQKGMAKPNLTDCLPGSGIDLTRFQPAAPIMDAEKPFRFLLVARMLKDKGVHEFVQAAKLVRMNFSHTEFQLLGSIDVKNPNSVGNERLRAWEDEGLIRYLGKTDDVRPYIANADCVVLPSYREGVPRSLLEAAAMGRPLITTDVAGCRDAVEDNISGLLCEVRSALDLADKMQRMIKFSPNKRQEMGGAGRRKIESQFDEKIVIQKYLTALDDIANRKSVTKYMRSGMDSIHD